MPSDQSAWDELRQLLGEEPSELVFRAVCSVLDTWQGADQAEAIAYTAKMLATWPDETRLAPWSWCSASAAGAAKPSWALVRTVQLVSAHLGCNVILTQELASSPFTQHWSALHCFQYKFQEDSTVDLLAAPERWSGVRHLFRLALENRQEFNQFYSSPLAQQLVTLQVYYHVLGPHSRPNFDLSGVAMPQPLTNLEALDVNFWNETDISSTLTQESLPKLRKLRLEASWPFDPAPTPEQFKRLLALPIFSQIRALEIYQYPEDAILALFSRRDLQFESLSVLNRGYTKGLIALQQTARRLTPAGIDAIVESGALRMVNHLKVESEHIGDTSLRLVEAITPGQLEKLELIDVAMTDDGAYRLAQLPQLANVTHLALPANQLTEKAVKALVSSPYLKNLRYLDLGSWANNPYYGSYYECLPQPIGNKGAATLAKSDLVRHLHTLRLAHANIGAKAVKALADMQHASALRVLDLSLNPIGTEGIKAFADGKLASSLQELYLQQCELDDGAIGYLVQANFSKLRALALSYNSVSEIGAQLLAESPTLASVWSLNLHDNFIGNNGLIALAKSAWLTHLLELDVEQDVWNYRNRQFNREVAEAVANSRTLVRLDGFWGGIVDEYHESRNVDPFVREGTDTAMDFIVNSKLLRPEVRYSVKRYQQFYDPSPEAAIKREAEQQEMDSYISRLYTSEKLEAMRRERDFRNRKSPG